MSDAQPLTLECSVRVSDGIRLPPPVDEASTADLAKLALELEQQHGDWAINIAFVTEAEIVELHDQFLGEASPTDIITFPFDEPDVSGGDIAICVPVAAEQGPAHGKSLAEELFFLVVHGVLHLVGHDDATPEMRAAMLARQEEIIRAWRPLNR